MRALSGNKYCLLLRNKLDSKKVTLSKKKKTKEIYLKTKPQHYSLSLPVCSRSADLSHICPIVFTTTCKLLTPFSGNFSQVVDLCTFGGFIISMAFRLVNNFTKI